MKNIIRRKLATQKAMCSACFPKSEWPFLLWARVARVYSPVSLVCEPISMKI